MRRKGENSVKCAGKSAFPPDENNDFTLGIESQTWLGLLAFDIKHSDGCGRLLYWHVRSENRIAAVRTLTTAPLLMYEAFAFVLRQFAAYFSEDAHAGVFRYALVIQFPCSFSHPRNYCH
jgi:hypothetical protein